MFKSVFAKYPDIAEIKTKLYSIGAEYASMSGSGSSFFGIFKEQQNVAEVEKQITEREEMTKQLMQSIMKDAFREE